MDRQPASGKDFAKQATSWSQYRFEVVSAYERVQLRFRQLGVHLEEDVTFRRFCELLDDQGTAVLILLAHWVNESVEFADRMVHTDEIVSGVPDRFDGILDLCICHPVDLAYQLGSLRPRCLVKLSHRQARPDSWLSLYLVLFELLARGELNYLDGLERAIGVLTRREADPIHGGAS